MRADKKEHLADQFRGNNNIWKAVKNLKGKFSPKFIQMQNKNGVLVQLKKRAEAIADYLKKQHWQNRTTDGSMRKTNTGFLRKMTEEQEAESKKRQRMQFTAERLDGAIKLTKKGKPPGSDGTRMELLKWLSGDNRRRLLNTINVWWKQREAPE